MLQMIDIGMDNAVAFNVSGKVTEEDMNLVLNEAKQKIQRYDKIVMLEQIESFNGVEIAGLVEEFKYLFEVGISNIVKVAIVTDKKWISHIVNIEDKLFKEIEMKCFLIEEQAEAIQFLKSS